MNNEIEVLRAELKLIAESSPKGSHSKVAKKVGFSEQYIQMVRTGTKLVTDSPDNVKLLKDCIKEYRKLINKEITKLQKL